ncbi:FkbM family methyltransferase [Pseudomonas sp. R2.Fl]|nr:FkbM family methyltransferase [Pseudomonas sp. R2.Fl]
MARPLTPPPAFDSDSPWGRYRPALPTALALCLSHVVPAFLAPLTKALRRSVKYERTEPLDLMIWGLKLRLLPRGNISEEKLYTAPQLFDREEFAFVRERIKPGTVFLDVGANAGIYSFWASRCQAGRGRILAVEPDPEMRRRLSFNAATNGLPIELQPFALSDRDGTAEFHINPNQRGTNSLETGLDDNGGDVVQTVEVRTLLSLLQAAGVATVDLMKIDIEGHEMPVLRHFFAHAPRSLWPKAMISEYNRKTADDLRALMEGCGYRVARQTGLNFIFTLA